MGYRFRRTVKIGGVRFNFGKTGVSASLGGSGASVTFGRRGVFSNIGMTGTGISYRSQIAGGGYQPSKQSIKPAISGKPSIEIPIKFVLDDETGKTVWKDENMNPLSEEMIQISKKQNRTYLIDLLNGWSNKINNKLISLLQIHTNTPPPDTKISYTPLVYQKNKPTPPNETLFIVIKPEKPTLKDKNFFSKRVLFLGNRVEHTNQESLNEYNQKLILWKTKQEVMNKKFIDAKKEYKEKLEAFEIEKINLIKNKQI